MPKPYSPSTPTPGEILPRRRLITSAPDGPGSVPARPGRLKLWPLETDRYGLDATFYGHWSCEDAEQQAGRLARRGIVGAIRPEADGGWTVRLGPLNSLEVAQALTSLAK
jgi:hypothetical protein